MKRILCYGDSNTWGFMGESGERFDEQTRWPCLLEQLTGYKVIEEGLNGRTTVFHDALMPYANGMDYLPACLLTHNPVDLVIFNLGTNDLKRHVCNNIGATGQGMAMLSQKTREILGAQQKILVISPVEISDDRLNLGPMSLLDRESLRQSKRFAEVYRPIAEQMGCDFLAAADVAKPGKADAVHMDAPSHRSLAEAVAKKVKEILG